MNWYHYLIKCIYIQVNVETLENMFTVNVESEQNCPGLLLTIIQVFEELGLDVLNAEAACNDGFELAAQGVWVCMFSYHVLLVWNIILSWLKLLNI